MAYNAQQIMAEIQGSNMNNMRNLIIKAQNDPRSLSQEEMQLALQYGQQLGIDMNPAISRDKATAFENIGAGLMGGVDAMLFGLVPDDMYSSYRTKRAKNIGKTLGTVLSLAMPGIGALKGTKMLAKGAKSAIAGAKGVKLAKTAKIGTVKAFIPKSIPKGVKTLYEQPFNPSNLFHIQPRITSGTIIKETKSFLDKPISSLLTSTGTGVKGALGIGKDIGVKALASAKNLTPREIIEMAKAVIQMTSLPANAFGAINPSADTSQLNPYTQSMGIGGMPEMP